MNTEEMRAMIGTRISIARKARGMTQEELAEKLQVHKQTVSRWERGTRSPNGEEIRGLVQILECSANFILGLEDVLTVKGERAAPPPAIAVRYSRREVSRHEIELG